MKKAAVTAVGVLVALLVLWGVVHMVISPVHPTQTSPENHFSSGCGWCHIVSQSADLIE